MNAIAERYVKLVLAVGPARRGLRGRVLRSRRSGRPTPSGRSSRCAQIDARGRTADPATRADARLVRMSWLRCVTTTSSSSCRRCGPASRMLSGAKMSFDEESARALRRRRADASRVVLPGRARRSRSRGCRARRSAHRALRRVSPGVRHSRRIGSRSVFDTAIAECRRRTAAARRRCRRARASRSSTSPTNRGAATTGIRGTTAA